MFTIHQNSSFDSDDEPSDASLSPRVELHGAKLLKDFQLPSLKSVRKDITKLPELKTRAGAGEKIIMINDRGEGGETVLTEPVAYNLEVPNLMRWSYFVRVEDVPDDILEDCIFILKMFIRMMEETEELLLRSLDHILPDQKVEDVKYFTLSHSRFKLACHLINPYIDRPEEAVEHLGAAIDADNEKYGRNGEALWKRNPMLYLQYGGALVLYGLDNEVARLNLERALEGLSILNPLFDDMDATMLVLHVQLARVLRQLGEDIKVIKKSTKIGRLNSFGRIPRCFRRTS